MKLELTNSHLWWVLKGLTELTSYEGAQKLRTEFPDIDEYEVTKDITELVKKIEELQ